MRFDVISDWWEVVAPYAPLMLDAAFFVLQITVCVVLLSWVVGLVVALCRASNFKLLQWPARFFIWFIRGTPALVQIFIVYFGLPQFGISMSPFVAGTLALALNGGSYVAEIIRGGLIGIPKGQRESALALGLSRATAMRRVILPQVVRVIIPPISNEIASSLKNTSLLSTITLMELTLQTEVIVASTFRPFEFYIFTALIYLLMTTTCIYGLQIMERRYAVRY
ncbi:amino acid ABC transporter permease [Pseudohalocynthiibacter aestuariivivens]|uniref:Amino acid ABC transporter permease n=1 Tax=Roseovarius pelagicus TaxID=2980108 RepID=A0ABY6D9G2_9RHOB|nr:MULTISPECIES: amino acid ABC transporter permease [Rhodobacterales]QIE45303.1 amino acid ABC transporter permease [Pseudohalocynthiibacter aestuariivivens]UXX82782.1 amino acid ABC transporter permease [Roseovarius pelagicus]